METRVLVPVEKWLLGCVVAFAAMLMMLGVGAQSAWAVDWYESNVNATNLEIELQSPLSYEEGENASLQPDGMGGAKWVYELKYRNGDAAIVTIESFGKYRYEFVEPDKDSEDADGYFKLVDSAPEDVPTTINGSLLYANSEIYKWGVGEHVFTVSIQDQVTAPVYVTITQSDIRSIQYTPVKELKMIEGIDSEVRQDSDNQNYHSYDFWFQKGDKLKVTRGDTTTEYTYTYNDDFGPKFIDEDGNELQDPSTCDVPDQFYTGTHWQTGNTYTFGIGLGGGITTVPVQIIANPVKSIAFEREGDAKIKIVEHTSGMWATDKDTNNKWFEYNAPYIREGDKLVVTNTDNSTVTYVAGYDDDYNLCWINQADASDSFQVKPEWDSNTIDIVTQDYEHQWTPSNPGMCSYTYMGATCQIPVTIVSRSAASKISVEWVSNGVGLDPPYDNYWSADDNSHFYISADGAIVQAYPQNEAYEVERVCYKTSDGQTHEAEYVGPGANKLIKYRIPAGSGDVEAWAEGKLVATIGSDGTMTFPAEKGLPNAHKLTFDMDADVQFSGTAGGGGGTIRNTVTIASENQRTYGEDYYLWPDSTTYFVILVPAGSTLATPQLSPSDAGTLKSHASQTRYDADTGKTFTQYICAVSLNKPATLSLKIAPKQATPTPTPTPTPVPTPTAEQPKVGTVVSADNSADASTYKVTKSASGSSEGTVTYSAPKKSAKSVTVGSTVTIAGKTYEVTAIADNAFKGSAAKTITVGDNVTAIKTKTFAGASKLKTLTLGKSVKEVAKNSFKTNKKLTKLVLKTTKLTKKTVKNALKGSKVKTVQVKVGSKKANKKQVKKYKKIFTKKICGKKVTVK